MGMPSAKGLFQRASIQSGSTNVRRPAQDRSGELAAAVLQELGLTRATIDKLQELPYERIVEAGVIAQRKMNPTPAAPGTGGGVNWAPVVDGRILPEHAWDPKASPLSADVPLLVGTTLNEFANSIQAGDPSLDEMSVDEAKKRLAAQRGDKADQILQSFQQKYPKSDAVRAVLTHRRHDRAAERGDRRQRGKRHRVPRRRICTGSSGRPRFSMAVRARSTAPSCRSSSTTRIVVRR